MSRTSAIAAAAAAGGAGTVAEEGIRPPPRRVGTAERRSAAGCCPFIEGFPFSFLFGGGEMRLGFFFQSGEEGIYR